MDSVESLKQELERERQARQRAEELLELKSSELIHAMQELEAVHHSVESRVKTLTDAVFIEANAYRELVENVSDIIYRSDITGCFTYVNPTAIRMTGYSEEELIGRHFSQLVRDDYKEKLGFFYANQITERIQSTYIEFPIITKDKREIWVGQTVDLYPIAHNRFEFISMCRDISDRRKMETALILSEEKYRHIIENLEMGLLELNNDGVIVKAHLQFCRMTGYRPDELEGQIATDLLLRPDSRRIVEGELEKRKQGLASVYEMEILKKDGTPMWVIISGAPYYDEKNEIAGTVGIHLDITARKKMEEELIQARDIAEKSLRSKDLFVANMSHEIRTPMNAIIGMSRLLADSGLTEKQQEYIRAIRTSSDNLLSIVNDLLDFSKIEAGKMELEMIPGDLNATLQACCQLIELKMEEKGLVFECSTDQKLADQYRFDPTRLNGVLTNLLHNAMKFTATGKVSFHVRVERQYETADLVTFEIQDTGIGIPKEKLEGIFDSFVQAESSTTRKYGGTGLGLAISRDLVRLMGGELHVHSEVGTGSVFYFSLRLEKTNEQIRQEEITFDESEVAGLRVLLVEDNQINRFMAQTILEQWAVEVTSAENGAIAIDLLQDDTFDLILMDMQMPILDGLQATWIIRNKMQLRLPVIALTANAVKGELEKCLAAGMNGFVSKPFRQEDLLRAIITVLHQADIPTETSLPTPAPEANPEAETLVDLSLLHSNTNNDIQFMTKMLRLVIDETERKVGEIEQLLETKDATRISQIAHSMKPSIDHVAVLTIRNLLREVEEGSGSADLFEAKTRELIGLLKALTTALRADDLLK
jgi:two-component system, sensor histidine kinase